MKICAIICEFNPFHNGHKYLIERAKELSGCDAVLCIMSGNFTQRGDICSLDKYTRAKHAVLGGADCVIQLPAEFAVAPAEIFARGAVKILSAIPEVTTLAFGCECGKAVDFIESAIILSRESEEFKSELEKNLSTGKSFIKSYAEAFKHEGGNKEIISNPNNILGLEYTKAVLKINPDLAVLPVPRVGAGHKSTELRENYSSASAIRQNMQSPLVLRNLPDYVFDDLKFPADVSAFSSVVRQCLFFADKENLVRIYGCAEGLENRLKNLAAEPLNDVIEKCTSKRYSSARIKRLVCANMLKLYKDDCEKFIDVDLYLKILAVSNKSADYMLPALAKSSYTMISNSNGSTLNGDARVCFEKDKFEHAVYNFITGGNIKDSMIVV